MDYERVKFERKIRQLETELDEMKARQAWHRLHLDTHDEGFRVAQERIERIETNLEAFSAGMQRLEASQERTQKMLEDFIAVLARSHGNGKEST